MDNAKDNNLSGFYLINNKPAETNRFTIDFIPGWYFFTFPVYIGILSYAINGVKNHITHTDGI
jgi:hypothetical protein